MPIYPDLEQTSVNAVLRQSPASLEIFNRFGVDTCCGGGLPLAEAARAAGVPLGELLAALAPVLADTPAPSGDAR